jgi:hypothetical protein
MGIFMDDSCTHEPMRIRQGLNLPATIDDYANVESRQEMGFKLNTFLNTVTGDPHVSIEMTDQNIVPRQRDIANYIKSAPKNLHARTAKNAYRVEVY